MDSDTLKELTVVWLGRIVSTDLLVDVMWALMQERYKASDIKNKENCLLQGKIKEFLDKIGKFVGCYCTIPVAISEPRGIKV
jgi:hypothetical protein